MGTAVLERQLQDTTEPLGHPPATARASRRSALLAMVGGLACAAVAAAVLTSERTTVVAPTLPAVVLSSGSYAPGHSSGWHVHPGIHSVVVLTGTLSFYDERCERQDVVAGEAYVGGNRPHLARNETAEPVTYVVSYAHVASSKADGGTAVEPPSGCALR